MTSGWRAVVAVRAALLAAVLGVATLAEAQVVLPLVPMPAAVVRGAAGVRIVPGTVIAVPRGDAGADRVARALAARVLRDTGLRLAVRTGRPAGAVPAIVIERSAGQAPEAYGLEVTPRGVKLAASGDAGLFYASVSLWQLLTADAASGTRQAVDLPGVRITDTPRFAWRGLMLDVARHFAPLEDVKALVDQMALHKLNVLHLHLSDDQGWRLEIKRYPELTRVGAWRTPPGGEPVRYGGFYTQAQMRDLVAYAAARHITLVPEFDMPGHAQAAVAAYPQVGVDIGSGTGQNPRPAVSGDWGVNPYLFNVDDATLKFLHDVLDEVMAVFPSTFIHVGGDEAIKDQWKASPAVQQRMRALGIKTEEALQSWFIDSMGDYLASKGRRLIGWDEILEGGLPESASVMSWRGTQGAVAAAKLGHDVVLAPAGALYFDNLQSARADEPEGRVAQLPIENVYGFEPVSSELDAKQARHVLGLEAALWTEYMPSRRHVEHAIFPRIAALAEVAWSPKAARDWSGFLPRLALQQQRYRRQGVGAADSAFAVQFDVEGGGAAALAAGRARVRLSNQLAYGDIRYTLDGSAPTPASEPYFAAQVAGIDVPLPALLRANVFAADGTPLAAAREQRLDRSSLLTVPSSGLRACPNGDLGLRVPLRPDATDWAPVFNVNLMDACWIYPQARLDGVRAIAVDAARLARNYGLAHDAVKVVQHPAKTPRGELEVRQGDCAGPLIASVPLPEGAALQTLPLMAPLPERSGVHDLCLRFTAPINGPLYAIDRVRLLDDAPARAVSRAQSQMQAQSLDAGWQFRLAPGDASAAAHPEVTSWRAATVPGTVQTDLLAAKLIPEPHDRDNEAHVQWVGLSDWEYRLVFQVDAATLAREHVALIFDGIDTFAQVSLNGQAIATADNMFRRWRIELKDGPAAGLLKLGENTLTVMLQSPIKRSLPWLLKQPYALPGAYDSQFGDEPKGVATSSYVRKAPYHYGWDWGPRLVALGLWQPVRLESWDTLRIEDFHVQQRRVDEGMAQLEAQFEIEATRGGPVRLQVDVQPRTGVSFTLKQDVVLDPGRNVLSLPLRIERPERWFPTGYGAQPMYGFKATVLERSAGADVVRATAERRTGLRSVELRREKDAWGRSFAFVVNGIPVFAKGANVIPLDSFAPRVTRERHRALLLSAQRANMNMLRLWGGGYYESDAFYEEADALGILIWQDFMFGGAITPPDTAFQENARQEAIEQVKRLRHHPSIVLWCGNNEVQEDWEKWDGTLAFKQKISPEERERIWSGNQRLFGEVLRGVVNRYAPDLPYWATSPGVDHEGPSGQMGDGDLHFWRVWGGSAPVETFLTTTPRFMSEYGLQSYPAMQTIASFARPEDLRLDSPVMRAHQKFGVAAGPDVGNDRLLFYIRKNYGEPKDFASFVYLSQVMQAEGIELATSHLRSQRPRTMGSLYWQLNDVWPGASWSSIDVFGRWKALQFHAKRFYADVAVTALRRGDQTTVSLVSDRTEPLQAELRMRVLDTEGRVLRQERRAVTLAPLAATQVLSESDAQLRGSGDARRTLAEFELVSNGERLSRSVVYFEPARSMQLPDPALRGEITADPAAGAGHYRLSLRAERLARAVWVDFGDLDAELEDNAFDLLPGERRTVLLRSAASLESLRTHLAMRSLHGARLR